MLAVGLAAIGILVATSLTLRAFQENMMFYVEIADVQAGKVPNNRNFRVGGLVSPGSVRREEGQLRVAFDLTDSVNHLTVLYDGVLPDLFREGQGIIAHGRMNESGDFLADTVLAKHDENYMPPEVAESLEKHRAAQEAQEQAESAAELD
jgi:cytochrome c-type biogenesis protein CcmE